MANKEWVVPTSWGGFRLRIDNARVLVTVVHGNGEEDAHSMSSVEAAQFLLALQECARDAGAEVGKAAVRRRK